MHKRINIITLGCSKNLVDSEKIIGNLTPQNYKVTHESDDPADIVIINTCGFINDAKDESIETILQQAQNKNEGRIEKLIITGCLSQRYHKELEREIPEVDAWFGVNDNAEILKFLNSSVTEFKEENRKITTPAHYSYLKIGEGCDRTCSFCAIPLIRGSYKSRQINDLVNETKMLAGKGVKELMLIAQDISYYGMDLNKRSMLPDLLDELVKVDGIEWIRLHYAYPLNFPDKIAEQISGYDKICKYLDVPLQHINSRILKSMRRGIDKNKTIDFINKLRDKIPGIAIRTTMMVGYPGETEEDFFELIDFVKQTRFERLGVFTYSAEEDTSAYALKDSVAAPAKEKRAEILMAEQQKISMEINEQKIGKVFKTIIDRREGDFFIGRTEFDSPEVDNEVLVKADDKILKQGLFTDIYIDDATEFELYGHPV